MMLQRYTLVQQRILRQGLFRQSNETTTSFSSNDGKVSSHKITPVESLLGCNEKRMLLGMIVQVRSLFSDPIFQGERGEFHTALECVNHCLYLY